MDDFKLYIIRIIIIVSIVQLGVIISGEKYKKLYSLVGAIFIIFAIISFPDFNYANLSLFTSSNYQGEYNNETVAEAFTRSVCEKIKEAIEENYGIKSDVFVSTDESFSRLYIEIICDCDNELLATVEEYVKNNFCTNNDEVIISNGDTV